MNWVNTIWSMAAAACLTLAAVHAFVWSKDRAARPNLLFAITASLIAVFTVFVLMLMHARDLADYAYLHRWGHVPIGLALIALLAFVRLYFGTGRTWLFWLVVSLRLLVLVLNFLSPASFNYREITALKPFELLGEVVSVPEGILTPWAPLGEGSALLALVFVADAAMSLWRRGNVRERRRAVVVGGSVLVCMGAALVNSLLIHTGLLPAPYFVSLFFVLIILAMAYELGQDLLQAGQLARDLRESEQRIDLAVTAANLGLWVWDPVRDDIWATPRARQMFGLEPTGQLDFNRFLQAVHPEDREPVTHAVARALNGEGEYEAEYRVVIPGQATSWIAARGRVEFNQANKPVRMRGVLADITERKRAEAETQNLRQELTHSARMSLMGELSASLAHELNQPLTAILSNAQAAQRFLAADRPDLAEFREILKDIVQDTTRARDVIRQVRALVKKSERESIRLDLHATLRQVVNFLHGDIVGRNLKVALELAPATPIVTGDKTQLQQVLINLLLNAFDAVNQNSVPDRHVTVMTSMESPTRVRVTVRDNGEGIPAERLEKLFQPFFTTKRHGLGMGLSLTRSIVESHGGRMWAENNANGGASFCFTLPLTAGT